MISRDKTSILAVRTKYRFKKRDFDPLNFGKATGFRSKTLHKHYIYGIVFEIHDFCDCFHIFVLKQEF